MRFFTEEDFQVSDDVSVEVCNFNGEYFIFVDNYYMYPDRVRDYVAQGGIKSNRNQKQQLEKSIGDEYLNGTSFYDGKFYAERCSEPKQVEINLYEYMARILDVQIDGVRMFSWRIFNQFMEVDISKEDPYFWPHTDKCYNCMVYLNPHNNMGAGTTFYEKISDAPLGSEHVDTWRNDSEYKELYTVLDSYNTMVVFPGHIYHGQRPLSGVHKDDMRVTSINFFGEKVQRILTPQ